MKTLLVLAGILAVVFPSGADPVPGPWVPLFKGVELSTGTNAPSPGYPIRQSVRCVRVDLSDPDVRVFPTPPAAGYVAENRETASLSVSNFVRDFGVKVAINAGFYRAAVGGGDPSSEGVACEVYGLQICTGAVVSVPEFNPVELRTAALLFTTNQQPILNLNMVAGSANTNLDGIFNAVTGYYPVLTNGTVVPSNVLVAVYPDATIHNRQPRTAFGISQDGRYLFLMTIDGRQSGYSDGAYDEDIGNWMLLFGAWDAINMDGGGSAAFYMADCAGLPVALNHSSYIPGRGRERYIGSHLGIFAKPLTADVNDIAATPAITTATVTWTTTVPSDSQVEYGLTALYGTLSPLDPLQTTNHSVTLSGLLPGRSYFFRVFSTASGGPTYSGCGRFTTTNVAMIVTKIFDITNSWRYSTENYDAVPSWKSPGFNDTNWPGGPGLLWLDVPGSAGYPFVAPKNTPLPNDPNTTYPFRTYYFRTHFNFTNSLAGASLIVSNFLDDGAIYYLNGVEVLRQHMNPAPFVYANATLAAGYSCSNYVQGDPHRGNGCTNCPEVYTLTGTRLTNLVQGDNLLAAEVHNYSAQSSDITFGLALLSAALPPTPLPPFITNLVVLPDETSATLTWTTLSNSSSQVRYGLTPALGTSTPLDATPVTNHSVTLTGLERMTRYYFQVVSALGTNEFTLTNSFTTVPFYREIVALTNRWRYSTNNLDGVNWTARGFDDASWPNGPALLWVDRSASPNPAVQPKYTAVPWNTASLYPWTTYYFRTRFVLSNALAPGFTLMLSNFVDDGAVFYLNGAELQRLRLPPAPAAIRNATLATATPPGDDAVEAEVLRLWGNALTNLVVGTNVLAVEVHNAAADDLDVTFGSALGVGRALAPETTLRIGQSGDRVCVGWEGGYLTLQQTTEPTATNSWSDVPGPVQASPYCLTNPPVSTFFRLRN
ncbi:MAG: phosphodiester glycosidase family protein [Verrucomicrobia bacterium]|nr:phosphodiester glycosidase family protein [Verrucomicrobiota bacterium]